MNNENINTPCFIIDTDYFIRSITGFRDAINQRFSNNIFSYSVKTNSLPYLLRIAKENGCFAEVVSSDEYNFAIKCGFTPKEIVYNGPAKNKETFFEALSGGSYVNIETKREIDWLKDYSGDKDINLGIRLNIDLGKLAPEDSNVGAEQSRFGFSYDNGEFSESIELINNLGYKIKGVHAHRGTRTRSLNVYKNICQFLTKIVKEKNLSLKYVDIGGGFYGNMPGKPTYDEYVSIIKDNIRFDFDTIIFEPGNGIIASPVDYVLAVIDKKYVGEDIILQTDGTRLDIDPRFHKTLYKYTLSEKREIENRRQILGGCTCMEDDRIMEIMGESRLEVGDRITFHCLGAYTMCLTPNFIRNLPRIYALEGKDIKLVRNNWDASSWFIGEQR